MATVCQPHRRCALRSSAWRYCRPDLFKALGPVLEQIASLTVKIKHYDRLVRQLTETEYVETQALIKVYGVGQLTALTYVLTLGNKQRFQRSRDVGCVTYQKKSLGV